MNITYHVSKKGSDLNDGSEKNPFLTINHAASLATMCDTVIVHEGEYRECVNPLYGGMTQLSRITYKSAENEKVIIKGSEQITDWKNYEGTVWKATIKNSFFGTFNPYKERIQGDWFLYPASDKINVSKTHLGDVYLNGKSFYEAFSIEEVKEAKKRETLEFRNFKLENPDETIYQWYCELDDENTYIYANFHSFDPNKELVEINVRKSCFCPSANYINFITVSGFEMAQAATAWAPPSAEQIGMLSTHWSYGWIIENNILHDAKCSAISVGKEYGTGHNERTVNKFIPGFQGQLESVFKALNNGWNTTNVGSHIIVNNTIYDCGQNGIVGNMGCIACEIAQNNIYNIGKKHEFFGCEIAGIKFHAPIDTYIHNNYVHHCTLGLWLDWQTQGTRTSSNLFCNNKRDFVVEVSHGPFLFDNNIFCSKNSYGLLAQGSAFVNNLFCGFIKKGKVLDRSTPYHIPHSTNVLGCSLVYGNDDRCFNNIYVGGELVQEGTFFGTSGYNGCPESLQEFIDSVIPEGNADVEFFVTHEQPAYIDANVYFNGATAFEREKNNYISEFNPNVNIIAEEEAVYLEINIPKEAFELKTQIHSTKTLGMTRIVKALFDDKYGQEIIIDKDYFGNVRDEHSLAGPFAKLKEGYNKIKLI